MKLNIREVSVHDAAGISNLLNPIIEEGRYTILDKTFTPDEEREFIRDFPERGVFNVALLEDGSTVVGFQNVEPFATYTKAFDHVGIIGTFVDGQHRGQGIAKHLFSATFELAKLKGYKKLFAYVRGDNERALSVYLKQGFDVVGTAKNHAQINGEFIDEVLIEKWL
ncbi:GNAT family N-acetyltransferase [Photobacterium makurazakiensis]|uniref:GNAT family N-acetyltransferase n=1 Tax=Photobacterium makurazakiensis TaxID=2910234 RepID=UPI003D113635